MQERPRPSEFFRGSDRLDLADLPEDGFDSDSEGNQNDEAMSCRAKARMERIQMLKERTRQQQRERASMMLEKQDEREAQLICMSRITTLEQKEMEAKKLGLENPLTQEEKEILADYRKEYNISDGEEEREIEADRIGNEECSDEDVEEVGAELKDLVKEKFKPIKINIEQCQEKADRQ